MKINFLANAAALTLLIVFAAASPANAEYRQVYAWTEGRASPEGHKETSIADVRAAKERPNGTLGGMTAVSVKVLRKGAQEVERNVIIRDGGYAVIGERYAFPIATIGEQINPDDFSGFWRLIISKVTFDQSGVAMVDATLDSREARQHAASQTLSVRIGAGGEGAIIHGVNGKDYVLSVRHVEPVI